MLDFFFFFQAEDGIRDLYVTGVQTCALPISRPIRPKKNCASIRSTPTAPRSPSRRWPGRKRWRDRKSTRLNSSHVEISYAVFCLKKKKKTQQTHRLLKKKKMKH